MKISVLLLVGVGCLWFFGKTQPIVVDDHSVSNNRQISCSKCGGTGSIEVPTACPKCGGTGKSEWYFKSKDKSGQWVQQGREFIVANREVKGSRRVRDQNVEGRQSTSDREP